MVEMNVSLNHFCGSPASFVLQQEAVVPPIRVQRVNAIPQTIAGKAPLVKSNLQMRRIPL
jgi:hypothetical protein